MASPDIEGIKWDIAALAASAGIRLRFDKVAVRVVDALQTDLALTVPQTQAVLLAIAAPIKSPAKMIDALENLIRASLRENEVAYEILGNKVCVRHLSGLKASSPKVLGFVHNPDSNAGRLLDFAQELLTNSAWSGRS